MATCKLAAKVISRDCRAQTHSMTNGGSLSVQPGDKIVLMGSEAGRAMLSQNGNDVNVLCDGEHVFTLKDFFEHVHSLGEVEVAKELEVATYIDPAQSALETPPTFTPEIFPSWIPFTRLHAPDQEQDGPEDDPFISPYWDMDGRILVGGSGFELGLGLPGPEADDTNLPGGPPPPPLLPPGSPPPPGGDGGSAPPGGGGAAAPAVLAASPPENLPPEDIDLDPQIIFENAAAGTMVGTLTVFDPDAGDLHTCHFVDSSGDIIPPLADPTSPWDGMSLSQDSLFALDPVTGNVYVAGLLDYESHFQAGPGYSAVSEMVRAMDDGGLTYDEPVLIFLNNINETPYGLYLDNASVAENSPGGTVLGNALASDGDLDPVFGTPSHVYSLVDDAGGLFAIDGGSGALSVAGPLDYESGAGHQITVRVTDLGGAGLFEQQTFTITVENVNEPPVDLWLSQDHVDEGAGVGAVVSQALVADPDLGDTHTFTLLNAPYVPFSLDPDNGEILVASALDYLLADHWDLDVEVTDSGDNTYQETLTIYLDPLPGDVELWRSGDLLERYYWSAPAEAPTALQAAFDDADQGDLVLINKAGYYYTFVSGGGDADYTIPVHVYDNNLTLAYYGASPHETLVDLDFTLTGLGGDLQMFTVLGNPDTWINAYDSPAWIMGGEGDDYIWGSSGADTIYGGGGDDFLFGRGGDNLLYGGAGNDHLMGGEDRDTLYGGIGDDALDGDEGSDYMFGEDGDDQLLYDFGDLSYGRVDGGESPGDMDVLIIDGHDVDLRGEDAFSNLEKVDMVGGDNSLTIDPEAILNMTDSDNTLLVDGSPTGMNSTGDDLNLDDTTGDDFNDWIDSGSDPLPGYEHFSATDEVAAPDITVVVEVEADLYSNTNII